MSEHQKNKLTQGTCTSRRATATNNDDDDYCDNNDDNSGPKERVPQEELPGPHLRQEGQADVRGGRAICTTASSTIYLF